MKSNHRASHVLLAIVLIVAILCGSLVCFTGCPNAPSTSVALVISGHKNFVKPNLTDATTHQAVYDAAYSWGICPVICIDGSPFLHANYEFNKPAVHIDNAKQKQLAEQNTQAVINGCQNISAKTAEVNTLGGIIMAAKLLQEQPSNNQKTMIIVDSGLSTTSPLDFSANSILQVDSSADDIVAQLKALYAIPDLTGISIIWRGLGEVAGNTQTPLTELYKHNLRSIWEGILSAGNAENISFEVNKNSEYSDDLPPVKSIPVIEDSVKPDSNIEGGAILRLSVQFEEDSCTLVNEAETRKSLKPVAEAAIRQQVPLLLVGSTASTGSFSDCQKLSENRANTCRDILVSLGVPKDSISILGIGRSSSVSLRTPDTDNNGNLIEPNAALNRAVFLMDAESDTAKAVLSAFEEG